MKVLLPKLISGISSPYLVIPVCFLWITGVFSPGFRQFFLWGSLFLLLSLLPVLTYVAIQVKRGKITDLHIMVREQRSLPFLIATFSSAVLVFLYIWLHVPDPIVRMAINLTANGLAFFAITKFSKLSIHAAALSGSVLQLAILVSYSWLWLLLVLPIVIWARVLRKRHTVWQASAAVLISSLVTILVLYTP
ncbi:hypothetical protein KGQ71_02140 [Patescibacteria group bacterium]|nr:hypothetical protein [Patescibacteria group bacterium]